MVVIHLCSEAAHAEATGARRPEVDEKIIRAYDVDQSVVEQYELVDFRYTGGIFQDEPIQCGLIKPQPLQPGQTYPLIVWMAGIGPEELDGTVGIGHLRWIDRTIHDKRSPADYPCFILAMQVKSVKGAWYDRYGDPPPADANDLGDEQITVFRELIDKVLATNAIDAQRIYLMGVSTGAAACFEFAMRYPDLFAAMVPLATNGGDLTRVHHIVNIPVWAFHSSGDHPENVKALISALQRAGGVAHLTEIDSDEHNCWVLAARNYDILGWLFAQRRGKWSYPPGFTPLPWWNWMALFALVGIAYCLWRFRFKQTLNAQTNRSDAGRDSH